MGINHYAIPGISTILIVLTLQISVKCLVEKAVVNGNNFSLACDVHGKIQGTFINIHWLKDGQHLQVWRGRELYHVTDAVANNSGLYCCQKENTTGCIEEFKVVVGSTIVLAGTNFSLQCLNSTDLQQDEKQTATWTKDGEPLDQFEGSNMLELVNASFNDGGIYKCSNNTKTTEVVVGRKPNVPPKPECFSTRNITMKCVFYAGDNIGDVQLCWSVFNYHWYELHSDCVMNMYNTSIAVDVKGPKLRLRTAVKNNFGDASRDDICSPVIRPDPPTITDMLYIGDYGEYTFNATFEIPTSWTKDAWLNYRAQYTQEGTVETVYLDIGSIRRKANTYFRFTVKKLAYSLVCLQVEVQYGLLGEHDYEDDDLLWSNLSDPVCAYTPMDAPSLPPASFGYSFIERNKTHPELRNILFNWEPPPRESRNGIIDHYQLILEDPLRRNVFVYEISGNFTEYYIQGLGMYNRYVVKLSAWTLGGQSDIKIIDIEAVKKPVPPPLYMWLPILVCSVLFLPALVGFFFQMKKRISANHLPDPLIPAAKMNDYLLRKRPEPLEKEIFDELKPRIINKKGNDNASESLNKPLFENQNVISSSCDTEYSGSSSGAICYVIDDITNDVTNEHTSGEFTLGEDCNVIGDQTYVGESLAIDTTDIDEEDLGSRISQGVTGSMTESSEVGNQIFVTSTSGFLQICKDEFNETIHPPQFETYIDSSCADYEPHPTQDEHSQRSPVHYYRYQCGGTLAPVSNNMTNLEYYMASGI